jgi:hypothetical protein
VATGAMAAMAGAVSQPALLHVRSSPSLLSSRVALSPSSVSLVKKRDGGDGRSGGPPAGLSVVAMAKKGKKGGSGSVAQKERAPSSEGGAKESAYATETRKIILSVHKLKKVRAHPRIAQFRIPLHGSHP